MSLVPSITETLFALGLGADSIVGRTTWCIHPAPAVAGIPRVGGTKTPSVRSILRLAPDLVLLDAEENRRETLESLESAGIRTWTCCVRRVAEVPPMVRTLAGAVDRIPEGRELSARIDAALARLDAGSAARGPGPIAVALIWHEPLMALSASRYGGDLLSRAGFRLPDFGPDPYPKVTARQLGRAGTEVLLLSSEPHDFTPAEGDSLAAAVEREGYRRPRVLKVDGEALTWFGARTAPAADEWLRIRLEA